MRHRPPGHAQPRQPIRDRPRTPHRANLPEKQLLLDLINQERTRAGAPPVTLGNSPVPQLHAEDMLENCFISHWGTDGLKPYMRHSLAGSLAPNGENVYSRNEMRPHRYVVHLGPRT